MLYQLFQLLLHVTKLLCLPQPTQSNEDLFWMRSNWHAKFGPQHHKFHYTIWLIEHKVALNKIHPEPSRVCV